MVNNNSRGQPLLTFSELEGFYLTRLSCIFGLEIARVNNSHAAEEDLDYVQLLEILFAI